jgi:hypothetical protein
MKKRNWERLLLGAAVFSIPAALSAQEREVARGDRIDFRSDRVTDERLSAALDTARENRAGDAPVTVTSFTLSVPVYWTNNADYADEGGRSDFHLNPTAQFAVRHEERGMRIDARLTASSDQYIEHEDNNASFMALRLQASAPDAMGKFTPYARYQPRLSFGDGEFGGDSSTTHDFTVGASGALSSAAKLDLFGTRREATVVTAERWQTGATLTFSGNTGSENLGWSLSQGLQGRFFTGGTNDGRKDIYSITSAGLTLSMGDVEITPAELSLEWNNSNRANRDYLVLSVGAGISLTF